MSCLNETMKVGASASASVGPVKRLLEVADDEYRSEDGHVMRREWGTTPNNNPVSGRWVLRTPGGAWLDFDQYRSDLAERNGFKLGLC